MIISMDEFEKYAEELLCKECEHDRLVAEKCWEICLRNWINAEVKKANDQYSIG